MNPYPIRHRFVCHALRILALAVIAIFAFGDHPSVTAAEPGECETTFLTCLPEEDCVEGAECTFGWEPCIGSVRCVGGDGCPDGKVAVICDPEPE